MDAILILGAANWPNGPSPALRRRTAHAAALWHAGAAPLIVPCGGLGLHPPSEAAVMTDLLCAAGVDPAAIRAEDRSTSTIENLCFARPILRAAGAQRVVIVTDGYHAPRAAMIARYFGLRITVSAPPGPARPPLRMIARETLAYPVTRARLSLSYRKLKSSLTMNSS